MIVSSQRFRLSVLHGLLIASIAGVSSAQTLITEFTTSTFTGTGDGISTQDELDFTFDNTVQQLDSFVAGGELYAVSSLADEVYVRRNNVNPAQSSIWYREEGSTLTAEHTATIGDALLGNTFRGGSDNTFVNGSGQSAGNIERLDFVFTGGLTASDALAFTVMDRGGSSVHDRFQIALITGWDGGANNATSYSDVAGQGSLWGGGLNPLGNFDYQIFRYNTGNTSEDSYAAQSGGPQGMGGLVFGIDDFNVTAGTTVYGYSLFGYDVSTGGDTNNLIDWNNATYFPTNTNDNNGGIDLAAINGVAFSVVPEPSTWALGTLAVIALGALRRPRRDRSSPSQTDLHISA